MASSDAFVSTTVTVAVNGVTYTPKSFTLQGDVAKITLSDATIGEANSAGNGTGAFNWNWAAVKAVKVSDEEKEKYPLPGKKDQYYEFRMDMSTLQEFPEREFMDALSYIGVIPE